MIERRRGEPVIATSQFYCCVAAVSLVDFAVRATLGVMIGGVLVWAAFTVGNR